MPYSHFDYSDEGHFLSRFASTGAASRLQTATLTYDPRKFPFTFHGHKTSYRDAYIASYYEGIEKLRDRILATLSKAEGARDSAGGSISVLDAVRSGTLTDEVARKAIMGALKRERILGRAVPSLHRRGESAVYFSSINKKEIEKAVKTRELREISGGDYLVELTKDENDDIYELILNMVESTSKAWLTKQRRDRSRGTGDDVVRAEIELTSDAMQEAQEIAKRAKALVARKKELAKLDVEYARASKEEDKKKLAEEKERRKRELEAEAEAIGVSPRNLDNYWSVVSAIDDDMANLPRVVSEELSDKFTRGDFESTLNKKEFIREVMEIIKDKYKATRLNAAVLVPIISDETINELLKDLNKKIKESGKIDSVTELPEEGYDADI